MFKKALRKLRGKEEPKKPAAPQPSARPPAKEAEKTSPKPPIKASSQKILTAEGWKRLMMKKYRKS